MISQDVMLLYARSRSIIDSGSLKVFLCCVSLKVREIWLFLRFRVRSCGQHSLRCCTSSRLEKLLSSKVIEVKLLGKLQSSNEPSWLLDADNSLTFGSERRRISS